YQQNSGDEYWGTIYRSQLIDQLLRASTRIDIGYLQGIEHAIGTIDNQDNTRPAARYFIPYLVRAYRHLLAAHDPLVSAAGHHDQLLVESVNDAITVLSGTGTQLGQDVPGFGTADISKWGYQPAQDQNWDSLDPLAQGVTTHCGASATQNRSTFMMAVDAGPSLTGQDALPPGQS